jgi:hypothetical protein
MHRRWLLGLALFLALAVVSVYPSIRSSDPEYPEPETLTLTTGSTKRVAGGRAQLWLSEVSGGLGPKGTVVDAVSVEFSCAGVSYPTWAVTSGYSEPLCGCRVRLLEVLDTRPPSARLEVIWTGNNPPPRLIQAASQSSAPGSARASADGKTTSRQKRRR